MKTMEALISKGNLSNEELDLLIVKIKQDYYVKLNNKIPNHCGLCDLFRFCRIINPKLICPWL